MRSWTLREVVQWAARDFAERGMGTPRLDAELLAAHALNTTRVGVYLDLDRPLSIDERNRIRTVYERRRRREPVAYIVGKKEFFGREFHVTSDVLIPRPDTETLVEHALDWLRAHSERSRPACRVLDLCTGSGVIGITLALELDAAQVLLTDLSAAAVDVARRNVQAFDLSDRVHTSVGDLFHAVPNESRYDLITANPPYISDAEYSELDEDIRHHEPVMALQAPEHGLAIARAILEQASHYLRPGGLLLMEIGADQGDRVVAIARELGPWADVRLHPDLGQRDRVLAAALSTVPSSVHER
jgi:release factor glutamine methyltransferase